MYENKLTQIIYIGIYIERQQISISKQKYRSALPINFLSPSPLSSRNKKHPSLKRPIQKQIPAICIFPCIKHAGREVPRPIFPSPLAPNANRRIIMKIAALQSSRRGSVKKEICFPRSLPGARARESSRVRSRANKARIARGD